MKRAMIGVVVLAVAGLTYSLTRAPESTVTLENARATAVGGADNMFMVTMDLRNDGPAVALTSVTSATGGQTSFMNPGGRGALVIPGGDTAQLAMDGAHVMLMLPDAELPEGGFHSLSLGFDDGSEVVARALRPAASDGMTGMHHGAARGVEVTPSPVIDFVGQPQASAAGFDVQIAVENFEFKVVADDAAHVPNEGHAHIYLNGLKLGRLYEEMFSVGALAPGDYTLSVALNTHDHRAYVVDGAAVEAVLTFSLP